MAAGAAAETVGIANSDVEDAALGVALAGWLAPKRDVPEPLKIDELEAATGAEALAAPPKRDVAGAPDAAGAEL